MDKPEFTGTVTSDYHTRLRDEFAMRAMVEIIRNPHTDDVDIVSKTAYVFADAMLTARSQTKPSG